MNARRKIILGSTLGAIAIHLAFLACGTPSRARDAGGADANGPLDAMSEMMGDVADRETSAADAQGMPTPMQAQCESVDGGPYIFAFFNVAQVQSATVPRMRASVCNQTGSPIPPVPGFSAAETCYTGTPYWVTGRVAVPCLSTSSTVRLVVE